MPSMLACVMSCAGNLVPTAWRQTVTAVSNSGHKAPVTRVMYNTLFREVCERE